MNVPDFHRLFVDWATSNDEMAVAAAELMAKARGGVEEASHLVAAGFAAGYVIRAKHELQEEATHRLANFDGGRPS